MDITQEVIDYCETQRPTLDMQSKFMFFSNNKVVQTSINRHLLKSRSIVYKDDPAKYAGHYKRIDIRLFESMYRFTIVRNPWSKVVSAFFHLKNKARRKELKSFTFDGFVRNVLAKTGPDFDPHFDLQYPKAFYNGECFLDFVGKIENLQSDWQEIAKHIDAPEVLPHSNRGKHKPYQTYYESATVNIVRKMYWQDIDAFGYTFGDSK